MNPGDNTSTDAMTSSVRTLLPQMSGFLTSLESTTTIVCVDHTSDYTNNHLQGTQDIADTVEGKTSYKGHA